ncbi:hypothetical protein GCM10027348_21780 [Hymenobacter tenuis]
MYALLSGAVLSGTLLPGCRTAGPGAGPRQQTPTAGKWLDTPAFEATAFQNPSSAFGPYTRWWWPGGDVDSTELRREVQLLAEQGFAGAEVEPFSNGLNPKSRTAEVQSWDSPAFYANVRAMLRQARQSGFTIDLNAGSGWPLGGAWVAPADGMLTLTHADTVVASGQSLAVPLPHRLPPDISSIQFSSARPAPSEFDLKLAKVQAVVGARIIGEPGAKQTQLDPASVVDLTPKVTGRTLRWQVPAEGKWAIVALYSVPDQQSVITSAAPGTPLVVNHFDSTRLAASYEHLLGPRTGLQPFFGNPLRAVFNDSYEFKTDRHFADDFLAYFQQQRGYDPRPWLPANLQPGYNNAYGIFMTAGAVPRFQFSDGQDWRRRYDYDQTIGDLFRQQFIGSSNRWMARRGLLHRTQAYGLKMDVIAGSGVAAIPEAEQLAYQGSEAVVKLVTSGAHLYNRPLIAQESFVYQNRAEMTTPQKMKAAADKSFAAGVTQLIYHGTPYKYLTPDFGREGWNTFSSPFMGFISFASGLNETDPFWADLKEVNRYVARAQYALRTGRPHTDVLVYFPTLPFTEDYIVPNPEEILVGGYLPGVEPAVTGMTRNAPKKGRDAEVDQAREWFEKVWPVINALEAAGITWEWVNDASLQVATTQNGRLNIRGNAYQAVLLADAPWLETASAQRLSTLTQAGAQVVSVGKLPVVQPGFRDYAANDKLMSQALQQALQGKGSRQLTSAADVALWARSLPQPIGFAQAHSFTRSIERELPDGSSLRFVSNKTDQWQSLTLKAGAGFGGLYWLDATTGAITKANPQQLTYQLPPYGSIFLYAAKSPLPTKLLTAPAPVPTPDGQQVATLTQWTITAGDTSVSNSPLFDWRTNPSFKSKSTQGRYTTTFTAPKVESGKHYFLDLGQVNYTAQVRLNGKAVANLLWAPYQADVTQHLKTGLNTLEVLVTPSRRNEFVTQGVRGNPKYAQFKTARKTLTPAGLVGPVVLKSR